jgi:hypothetical protein
MYNSVDSRIPCKFIRITNVFYTPTPAL